MDKTQIAFLKQLLKSIGETEEKVSDSLAKKDAEKFNKSKKLFIEIQNKISEVVK